MHGAWHFYRFDYAEYAVLRPRLRAALALDDFADLVKDRETQALFDSFLEESPVLSEARSLWLQTACCVGEPLAFDRGLTRFVALLRQNPDTETIGETLSRLLTGGPNLEPWLQPAGTLLGFLNPDEVHSLHREYADVMRHGSPGRRRRGRPRRRGGLLNLIRGFCRRLLDASPRMEDIGASLGELIAEADRNEEGIALVNA